MRNGTKHRAGAVFMAFCLASAVALPAFAASTWYVAPAPIGDDSYDGTASNHVSGTVGPKRTLAAALALARSYDVVKALPGVYDEGSYQSPSSASYYGRVYVPSGVRLESMEGPEKTFIVGKGADAGQGLDTYGNGPGAIRCVLLGGTIRGFTICGGRVRGLFESGPDENGMDTNGCRGGGIYAPFEGALAIDCIISNNVAWRGGGMYGAPKTTTGTDNRYARAVKCRFLKNFSNNPASGSFYVDAWNCYYKDNGSTTFGKATARNCTILNDYTAGIFLNSIVTGADGGECHYTNSLTVNVRDTSVLGEGSVKTTKNGGAATYSDGRPSAQTNIGIDQGVYAYYTNCYPSGSFGAESVIGQDVRGFPRVVGEAIDIGAGEYASLALYVDAVNGDDANDALAPGTGHARRTMKGVLSHADLAAGDVVHAAPGVYNEGLMGVAAYTTNRVAVPAGVGLVADEGPDVTIIEGAAATTPDLRSGCGTNAVRCVRLNASAWIKGFTLRNGATAIPTSDAYGDCGGGVRGEAGSFTIGCRFVNCSARRGGAAFAGNYVGCFFDSSLIATGNSNCSAGYNAAGYFGCVFDGVSVYGNITNIVNCSFFNNGSCGGNSLYPHVYNSYVGRDQGKCRFHRSIVGSAIVTGNNASTANDGSLFSQTSGITYDPATYRPLEGSLLTDFGDSNHWKTNFPDSYPACLPRADGKDYADGQRIYNGKIDVGAGEYDWRGTFGTTLRRSGVAVTEASEGVTLGAGGIDLADGDSFAAEWTFTRSGCMQIATSHTGAGTLSVTVDGSPVTADANGFYRMFASAGSHVLELSYSGGGGATVCEFKQVRGACVSFR